MASNHPTNGSGLVASDGVLFTHRQGKQGEVK